MALYRKYRPATFAEVVGQEHVTEPLSAALNAGRINHAYLFSGPRGCGKTSSARILARSLNCEHGPTATPCGTCNSCVALGPGGPGNLDVIELDAASHGGVDDTRELRDRAFYAPAESRYRVFIVDEAHMVTNAGFNALLKIVEEPPEHLIFIFATTEPEKVLPTIKSRTHHYPFRLLPPPVMRGLVERICASENVHVQDTVFPLVIRAGGGSPRDTLSVLDQLIAGAGEAGVAYDRAVSLLGITDSSLIDAAVDGLANSDGAALFGTINDVMDAGFDPRRFTADLLERIRDLILVQAVPDALTNGLVDAPADGRGRMLSDVERIGPATLARYAELLHAGLSEMRGATAPRLLLEVLCARMLLPAASATDSALLQRLERLERGTPTAAQSAQAGAPAGQAQPGSPVFERPSQRPKEAAPNEAPSEAATTGVPEKTPEASAPPAPPTPKAEASAPPVVRAAPEPASEAPAPPSRPTEVASPAAADEAQATPAPAESDAHPGLSVSVVEAAWGKICANVRAKSKIVEVMLSGAKVTGVRGNSIMLSHETPALMGRLREARSAGIVLEAFRETLGTECELVWGAEALGQAAKKPPTPQERNQSSPPNDRPRFVRKSAASSGRTEQKPPQTAPGQASRERHTPAPGGDDIPPPDDPGYPEDPGPHNSGPPSAVGQGPVQPVAAPDDEDALLEEARRAEASGIDDSDSSPRRDPEELAIELLTSELGARRIE
ncbi:DNA polymerase III subunit gamma and tau [Hoyosella subflava]|uniref:DNA polymerase III subunit gamma/tau n=1 Tax=Hoyosella subflava (strain DSM 45089 / JCM 17490 / NBRC 109087 / DQS3-9A1) TaxID=443218 RepID=F6EF98_HOYSD|nr:DNA polymerase III subunit gamma and tau [Hoyosella subflava]AEF38677.1 DNA polymerase III, subunits gamma and tau [Hoyosella subflava DQS3-9A1]